MEPWIQRKQVHRGTAYREGEYKLYMNFQLHIRWASLTPTLFKDQLHYYSQFLLLLLSSCLVMSDSLWPHGLQHAMPPCPSSSPKVCPSSCPLHWWCQPAISSSDALLSFCLHSFPASGTVPMNWLFASDDQNNGASTSAPVLPMSIQGWFLLDWLVWSPYCLDSQESPPAPQFEGINSLALCLLYGPKLTTIHDHWEGHSLTI